MRARPIPVLLLAITCASAPLHADVTIVSTIQIEGGPVAMLAGKPSRLVQHIKGAKARLDVEAGGDIVVTTIADVGARRMHLINHRNRTVQVFDGTAAALPEPGASPEVKMTLTPTGRVRTVLGVECTEQAFTVTASMAQMGGADFSPEVAAMLQGANVRTNGSICMASAGPGAAEYVAYVRAAAQSGIAQLLAGGASTAGLDPVVRAMSEAPGVPYVTEMQTTIEGTGPAVEMFRQMGTSHTTVEVRSVSTDSVPDSVFALPEDYAVLP